MTAARILVVEDDSSIRLGLCEKLRMEGHEVVEAVDGEAARERFADGRPVDLVILDLMLPKLDGLSVLRWLRQRDREVPVLILSAKGSEDEKVAGLRAGADDYLSKPFGLKELTARVEALLRRRDGGESFVAGDLEIDVAARRVFRGGDEVKLSRKELDVLLFLVRNRHRVVSREQILAGVWGHYSEQNARAVDFHVLNLRRKLEADPRSPRHIVTRHGVGFQIVAR